MPSAVWPRCQPLLPVWPLLPLLSHRFLVYGRYCSQVESASKHLDRVASAREDVQMKLEVGAGSHLGGSFTPSQAPGQQEGH